MSPTQFIDWCLTDDLPNLDLNLMVLLASTLSKLTLVFLNFLNLKLELQ